MRVPIAPGRQGSVPPYSKELRLGFAQGHTAGARQLGFGPALPAARPVPDPLYVPGCLEGREGARKEGREGGRHAVGVITH